MGHRHHACLTAGLSAVAFLTAVAFSEGSSEGGSAYAEVARPLSWASDIHGRGRLDLVLDPA